MPLNKSWHDYNESLIERGRILMDIGFLKSQGNEIKMMNDGTFEYSHTYIQFLAFLNIGFKIAYRTVQEIVRGLSAYIRIERLSEGPRI